MKLSILIPTLPERYPMLSQLVEHLGKQAGRYPGQVEILIDDRGREITTGKKRNDLLQKAQGYYSVFIDDDDWVEDCYIEEIMKAITTLPDVLSIKGWMTTNGTNRIDWKIYLGADYVARDGIYHRFPNHITPMKTSAARQGIFPDVSYGEDYAWACQIRDKNLLHTEVAIDKEMYHYKFVTK